MAQSITRTASATYGDNMRELRADTAKRLDALYETWLASDMSAVEFDQRKAAIYASEARHTRGEGEVYRLNRRAECAASGEHCFV